MQFTSKIAALVLFSGAALAAPVAAPAAASEPGVTVNEVEPGLLFTMGPGALALINNCGGSSFINRTGPYAPLVNDCRQIAYNIRNGGTWVTDGAAGNHRQLVQYGTCAFGVEIKGGDPTFFDQYKVGNSDIIDLINDSINRFQSGGRIGAEGRMPCQKVIQNGDAWVSWGIYHD